MTSTLSAPQLKPLAPPKSSIDAMAARLRRLARGDESSLDAYLARVDHPMPMPNTAATCHCYTVTVDANGRVGVSELVEAMVDAAVAYAIPRDVINKAFEEQARTGTPDGQSRLVREAHRVFTDIANTGEGGELLLFLFGERVLKLPQVLCKMSLKSANKMHYNGSDGVHADLEPDTGVLRLWWGESKVFGDVTAAVTKCFKSLTPFLRDSNDPDAARQRDMLLLRDYIKLDDPDLENALRCYFDRGNPLSRKVRYCGLALVGFDCDAYPAGDARAVAAEVERTVRAAGEGWRGHIDKRIREEKIEAFDLHVICVPFPSVDDFRRRFLRALGQHCP